MKRFLPGIKNIISAKDLIPKIICLLLSLTLWMYVNSTKVGDVKFRIPVDFINLSENFMILEGQNQYVTVTLTGRKDILKNVNIKSITASVNLENPDIGVNKKYQVKVIRHAIPENIDVSVSAEEMMLTVDREIQKKVRVEPNIQKPSKEGFLIGNVRVDPPFVIMEGPESYLKNIESAKTHQITIGNETGRIEREAPIDRTGMPKIKISAERVRVIIPVIETTALYDFEVRIKLTNSLKEYKYVLVKQYVKVYVRSKEGSSAPSLDDIAAFVDMSSLNYDEFMNNPERNTMERDLPVNISVKDDDYELITVIPPTVLVKISRL